VIVSYRMRRLKRELLMHGGPQVSIMSTPWYADVRGRTQPMQRDPDRKNYMVTHALPVRVEIVKRET